MKLIALLQARNEERFLPGWLENIAPAVDGIVALDDGSEDATPDLLTAHPKTLEILRNPPGRDWNERSNQMELIKAGRRQEATWFLCADADERLERSFVGAIRHILAEAEDRGVTACSLRLRELWGDRRHYRDDGIWGRKARYRLFRNDPSHRKFDPRPLHRHWMPLEIVSDLARIGAQLPYNVYHLRMVRPEDRRMRHQRYMTLDPDCRFQPEGYDYLIDENGISLAEVPSERDFDPAADPAFL